MEIKKYDIANGKGIRVSLFVSGCEHKCTGCFNPETWPSDAGQPYTKETEDEIINTLGSIPYVKGLTLLGGEPLSPDKISIIWKLVYRVKHTFPELDIWCYTGYLWEELCDRVSSRNDLFKILHTIDILVDGPFVQELSDKTLKFRGSSNQRIIRCSESIKKCQLIIDDDLMAGL